MEGRVRLVRVMASKSLSLGYVGDERRSPALFCDRAVEIVAHRGASFLAPENTLAAVKLAWELGADAVEIDVHLSMDKRIVAIHDPCTKRTAGVRHPVARTSSAQLRRLNVGHRMSSKPNHESIPYLEEILRTVPPRGKLFIEIKCGPEIIPTLHHTLTHESRADQITIIGFDLDTLGLCKQAMPTIPMYYLRKSRFGILYRPKLIEQVQAKGLDGLSVKWHGLTASFAKAVKTEGLDLFVWTVDDIQNAQRLAQMGIDGITTNRPGWLRTHLFGPAQSASA